jgi:hypothetical protein
MALAGDEKEHEILIRVSHLAQLFNSLDPSPFRERDLDVEAERFIIGWAQEAPRGAPIAIIVELPHDENASESARTLEEAVHNNFDYNASQATRELHELFREGWQALAVGVPILAVSLAASGLIAGRAAPNSPWRLVSESLLILGWVANWRPSEIFVYGWWPIVRRRSLYRRLAAARVAVRWA